MKIAILDNDLRVGDSSLTTGVQTYAIHLKDGLELLGHEVDIIGFTKTGRRTKAVSLVPEYKVSKQKEREEVLKNYDSIIILIGIFKPDEQVNPYEFLRGLKKKYVVIEHSHNESYEKHGYKQLFEVIGKVPVACNSLAAQKLYKDLYGINATVTRQPFSRRLLPQPKPKTPSEHWRIVFPHRLIMFKRPDATVDFLQIEIDKKIDWELNLYGATSSSTIYWSKLKHQLDASAIQSEKPFTDKRIVMHKPYTRAELADVYANADVTFHSSKTKGDGGRVEYTLLESIHFKTPIVMHPAWAKGLDQSLIDKVLVDGKTFVSMEPEHVIELHNNKMLQMKLVREGNIMIDEHFDAQKVGQMFIDMLETQ